MIVVAVPVKDLVNAKQRLMSVLPAGERMDLARAMLRDVLAALAGSVADEVWVVTRDGDVRSIASELRAQVLPEAENRGHTAAVRLAQAEAARRGVEVFVTVPGDTPCVTASEIDALVRAARVTRPVGVFAPSRSRLGTNGVALSPTDAMALTFGEPSFENHLAAARDRGLDVRSLILDGLSLDVDGPDDLAAVAAGGGSTATAQLIERWRTTQPGRFSLRPPTDRADHGPSVTTVTHRPLP